MNNKKRKILFLEQYAKLTGGQRVLLTLVEDLKSDYDICVLIPEEGIFSENLKRLKIKYTTFPIGYYSLGRKTFLDILSYSLRLPYLVYKLKRLIRSESVDLVYANAARTFIWSTIACHITKTPLIWHVHSIFDKGIVRALCIFFAKRGIVKKIIVVSKAVKKPLKGLVEKIEILYNAIDTTVYFPPNKANAEPLIAMVGALMEWKGIDDFIRAAKTVSSKYPGAKFTIVGDVLYDKEGQKYKEQLRKLVDKLNLNNNLLFTGYREDIAQIMREVDIFILASRRPDPCPTSLLQAMASGAAVIATNFGGPAEIIDDGKDGLLYTAGDHNVLAEKILFLLDNPQARIDISRKACQKIRDDFNQVFYLRKVRTVIEAGLEI